MARKAKDPSIMANRRALEVAITAQRKAKKMRIAYEKHLKEITVLEKRIPESMMMEYTEIVNDMNYKG